MNFGMHIVTHGMLTRDAAGDAWMAKVPAAEMRPVEVAVECERLGYHSVWLSDHVVMERVTDGDVHPASLSGKRAYPDLPNMLDPLTMMAAIAGRTTTLVMSPSVYVVPYRHPLVAAHQFATLDVLSNGRVIVGVGNGWMRGEYEALGLRFEDRGPQTEECLQIYRLAWTEDWIDFHGRFYDIANVSLDPKPVQKPHPPLWYGGITPVSARRAARYCQGFYPLYGDVNVDPALYAHLREVILREGEQLQRDLSQFTLGALICARLVDGSEPHHWQQRPGLTGSAEQILEDIERFAAYGYSHISLHFDCPSGQVSEVEEQIARFAAEVLPEARRLVVAPFA